MICHVGSNDFDAMNSWLFPHVHHWSFQNMVKRQNAHKKQTGKYPKGWCSWSDLQLLCRSKIHRWMCWGNFQAGFCWHLNDLVTCCYKQHQMCILSLTGYYPVLILYFIKIPLSQKMVQWDLFLSYIDTCEIMTGHWVLQLIELIHSLNWEMINFALKERGPCSEQNMSPQLDH